MYQRSSNSKEKLEEFAVEKKRDYQDLCFFLATAVDTEEFAKKLADFIDADRDINALNLEGKTILDACDCMSVAVRDYSRRRGMIVNAGGKLGREVSNAAQLRAAESIIPGFDSLSLGNAGAATLSAYRKFSFEDKELRTVSEFLAEPIVQYPAQEGDVDICAILIKNKPAIGKLFDAGSFVSTLFLIKDDWVITARHSVNYSKPENLTVMFGDEDFDESIAIAVSGAIEGGRKFGLDYVILKLSTPAVNIKPLILNTGNSSTSLLFVGYNQEAILQFSTNPDFNLGNLDQLRIVGYQGTGACFSGSPYFDLDGQVCGLHSCASTDQKTGIYIETIIEANVDGPLACLIRGDDVSNKPLLPGQFFGKFRSETARFEYDERGHLDMSVDMSSGKAVFSATGAPNNQAQVAPKQRIATRLNRLSTSGKILTSVQESFLAIGGNYATPAATNIQIAHNIAISAIRAALVNKLNTLISTANEAAEMKATCDFADAIASSDDESPAVAKRPEIKKKLPKLIRRIRTEKKKPEG